MGPRPPSHANRVSDQSMPGVPYGPNRCRRGFYEGLKHTVHSHARYASLVATFCQRLSYTELELLISKFQGGARGGQPLRTAAMDKARSCCPFWTA